MLLPLRGYFQNFRQALLCPFYVGVRPGYGHVYGQKLHSAIMDYGITLLRTLWFQTKFFIVLLILSQTTCTIVLQLRIAFLSKVNVHYNLKETGRL